LLINGLDAMEDQIKGSKLITISTSTEDANGVIISFADSGKGIPDDKIEEIFEPFHTTKSKGLGLGLSISKLIIDAHNGKIWAENKSDGGANFLIFLPRTN
jgi:C4-dicarboxylate-specific signal transduction histidine kinase